MSKSKVAANLVLKRVQYEAQLFHDLLWISFLLARWAALRSLMGRSLAKSALDLSAEPISWRLLVLQHENN